MPRVFHIVISTTRFAGVERYVCEVAAETARRGWEVSVIGGDREHMQEALGGDVRWLPGSGALESVRSILRLGRSDIAHAHMTAAEAVAVATRRVHGAPVLSTRHFAAPRGGSRAGRTLAPWIARNIAAEIAVGEFVAASIERRPSAVVPSGVPASPCLWDVASRNVLVLQRLDAEKDTLTALRAWSISRLSDEGWSLRVVGEGAQHEELEQIVRTEAIAGVTFTGWTDDVVGEHRRAGIVLATAPAEPLGLAVLEAMSAGIPVVASAAGGHLETAALVPGAPLFPAGDPTAAAAALRSLLPDAPRSALSVGGRRVVAERFGIGRHVDGLLAAYRAAGSTELRGGSDHALAQSW